MKEELIEELELCLKVWENLGKCKLGKETNCKDCGCPYVLLKMISGQVLNEKDMKRLDLKDWKYVLGLVKENLVQNSSNSS
jgi:hypothetical protein